MKDSKVNMEDVLSAVKRVEGGQQVKSLTVTFFLWLCASITITVASGVYLWEYDSDKICKAPNSMNKRSITFKDDWIDVNRRYRDVLKIFFSVAIIDVFRSLIMIIAACKQSTALATLYQALVINDVLGFGAIFVLHAFRLDLAGKICAGDFKEEEAYYPHTGDYLISQGRVLIGFVCFVWVVGFVLFMVSTCVMICHH
jgi:hypothetical protein